MKKGTKKPAKQKVHIKRRDYEIFSAIQSKNKNNKYEITINNININNTIMPPRNKKNNADLERIESVIAILMNLIQIIANLFN